MLLPTLKGKLFDELFKTAIYGQDPNPDLDPNPDPKIFQSLIRNK
jgi:hypothetical protein